MVSIQLCFLGAGSLPQKETPRSPSLPAQGSLGDNASAGRAGIASRGCPATLLRGNLAPVLSPLAIGPRCCPHAQRRGVVSRCLSRPGGCCCLH